MNDMILVSSMRIYDFLQFFTEQNKKIPRLIIIIRCIFLRYVMPFHVDFLSISVDLYYTILVSYHTRTVSDWHIYTFDTSIIEKLSFLIIMLIVYIISFWYTHSFCLKFFVIWNGKFDSTTSFTQYAYLNAKESLKRLCSLWFSMLKRDC